jgi:hypothetical protein
MGMTTKQRKGYKVLLRKVRQERAIARASRSPSPKKKVDPPKKRLAVAFDCGKRTIRRVIGCDGQLIGGGDCPDYALCK